MSTKSQANGLGRIAGLLVIAGSIAGVTTIVQPGQALADYGSIPDFRQYCPAAYSGSLYVRRVNNNGFAPRCRQSGTEHDIDARAICRWWTGSPAHHWVENKRYERIRLHCDRQKVAHGNPGHQPKGAHGRNGAKPRVGMTHRRGPNRHGRAGLPKRRVHLGCSTSWGGKYGGFMSRIYVPSDIRRYGRCRDYGWWSGRSYNGVRLPRQGYWVYVYPNWYVWYRRTR